MNQESLVRPVSTAASHSGGNKLPKASIGAPPGFHFTAGFSRGRGAVAGLALLLSSSLAHAALIPGDLVFDGEFGLDLGGGGPGAAQHGTFYARQGGVDTPGAYVNGTLIAGVNPTIGILQDHGDGVVGAGDGFGGTAFASIMPNNIGQSGVFADTDLGDQGQTQPLLIFNFSLTRKYRISFSLSYDHSVDAFGPNVYAESDLEVLRSGQLLFEAEIISDTVFGNSVNKTPIAGAGGLVSDSGTFFFDVLLTPQNLAVVELDYTLEGEDYEPLSGLNGNGTYFLSVDNVQLPLPGTTALLLPLMPVLWGLRRRRAMTKAA